MSDKPKIRYLTRTSGTTQVAAYKENGELNQPWNESLAWKLDVGAECNRLLDFADELDSPLNADRYTIRDAIRSIVSRVIEFEELEMDLSV